MLTSLRRSIAVLIPTAILALAASPAFADNVTAVNQIFTGKTCLGALCVDGETFGSLPLRVKTGDTPGIQFVQTGDSGFTPQQWDVAGNESNFFVRDITGGSKLPFRIRPGAPTSAIDIRAENYVSTSGVFAFDTSSGADKTAFDTSNVLSGLAGLTFQTYTVNGNASDVHLQPEVGPFSSAYFGDTNFLAPADIASVALAAAKQLKGQSDSLQQRIGALESSNAALTSANAALTKSNSKLAKQTKSMAKSLKSLQKQVKKLAKRK